MKNQVLIDTSPLVAISLASETHHKICKDTLHDLQAPLITTLSALTEALWLLRKYPTIIQKLLYSFSEGLFVLEPIPSSALTWISKFLKQYENLDVQLADATLVYVAEQKDISTIFTLDRKDFSIFRFNGNKPFTLIPELSS